MFLAYLLCVLVGGVLAARPDGLVPTAAPVPVAVYYESLCPDSIKFITKQLYPTYKTFGKFIDLTLVPYGKSTQLKAENGSWVFDCHHGKNECYGNKVQACALKHLADINDKVDFVNCVMDKVKPKSDDPYPGKKCAEKLTLSYEAIEGCVKSPAGDDELAKMGDLTNSLQPKLTNVPSIIFNATYNMNDQKQAESDFMTAICQRIGGHAAHKECKNSAPSTQAAILVTLAAAILCKVFS